MKASERLYLLRYFVGLILIGTILLSMPFAWSQEGSIRVLDAAFTATSAVCVTGLIVVDTALFSLFGKIVIVLLIQFGGLGIITFSILMISGSAKKGSLKQAQNIQKFFLLKTLSDPKKIVQSIVALTLFFEVLGALFLLPVFWNDPQAIFTSIFHSVSAFCNAGFSTFSNSLESFRYQLYPQAIISVLIITGGLGFIVHIDLAQRALKHTTRLSLHTKIVLIMTVGLILSGWLAYMVLGVGPWYTALFQSITTRTAGFNTIPQGDLGTSGEFFTSLLMFIGGAPGSIAGGIKVTTFAIILAVFALGFSGDRRIHIMDRAIPSRIFEQSINIFIKALGFILIMIMILAKLEPQFNFADIWFECFSAFGTVGLSTGITPMLRDASKIVIMLTMFTGRVGILVVVIPLLQRTHDDIEIRVPEEEILVG